MRQHAPRRGRRFIRYDLLLSRKRHRLTAMLGSEPLRGIPSDLGVGDIADMAFDAIDGGVTLPVERWRREELVQIDAAFYRIDDGTYGICENCGKRIPAKRLAILPFASLCVRCQGEAEMDSGGVCDEAVLYRLGEV